MDENRISGKAQNIDGKVGEGIGRVTDEAKTQAEGLARQAGAAAQDMYGQARDAASDIAGNVQATASSLRNGCEILSRRSHILL